MLDHTIVHVGDERMCGFGAYISVGHFLLPVPFFDLIPGVILRFALSRSRFRDNTYTMGSITFPKIYNTYFVAFIATVGGMLFGFDISSMSAIIGTEQYNAFFNKPAGVTQGAIGSALAAGSVVGSIIAGPISDRIGRRDSIGFACLWWLVGTAVQTSTSGIGSLIAGRVLNGVCVGITSSQVPVYLAEISRKEKRGAIIIIQQLAIGMSAPSSKWKVD